METVVDADPVASVVRTLMVAGQDWQGTASELLVTLSGNVGERMTKSKDWPSTPRALSGRLRRAATFLRKVGIDIDFDKEKGKRRTRIIRITATGTFASSETGATQPSEPSEPSAYARNTNPANRFTMQGVRTVGDPADGSIPSDSPTVRASTLKSEDADDADGADANSPSQSVWGEANTGACEAGAAEEGGTWRVSYEHCLRHSDQGARARDQHHPYPEAHAQREPPEDLLADMSAHKAEILAILIRDIWTMNTRSKRRKSNSTAVFLATGRKDWRGSMPASTR